MHSAETPFRIPAAIAYLWEPEGEVSETRLSELATAANALVLGPGILGFCPHAGNPDVVEAAILSARTLIEAPLTAKNQQPGLNALIFPSFLEQRGDLTKLISDALLDDLHRAPPLLEPGAIHLTGHATRELETAWLFEKAPTYTGESGRSRTIWRVDGADSEGAHQRNPAVLRRPSALLTTPALLDLSQAIKEANTLRVLGDLGVGKSRLTQEALAGTHQIWVRCWAADSSGPNLGAQLTQALHLSNDWPTPALTPDVTRDQDRAWPRRYDDDRDRELVEVALAALATRPAAATSVIVIDDAQQADALDQETIERLIPLTRAGSLRLVLLSRHASWVDWLETPSIEIEPLTQEQAQRLTEGLTQGLQLPAELIHLFTNSCAGNPFAIEEGLHSLVRRRLLRSNYGNFFFSGPKDTKYLPTARLTRHLLSEAMRVDAAEACFRLASAHKPTPKELLALSSDTDDGRLQLLCDIGLFRETEVKQHRLLDFSMPAFRESFRQSMEHHVVQRLRGELLEPTIGGGSAEQAWDTYQELAGTPKAIEALLEVLALPREERPTSGLFEALERELAAHCARKGDESVEFELLWAYLPLARRFGETSALMQQIERALELCDPSEPRRMALLALHSEEALVQGELEAAERRAIEGIDLARKHDPRRQSILLLQLGKVLQRQDRHSEAKRLLLDLLQTIKRDANPAQWATCNYYLGNIYLREQDFEAALEHHQAALKHRRAKGSPTTLGHSLSALATLNLSVGNYSQSLELYHEALDILGGAPDPSEQAFPLVGIGKALSRLGDFAGATAPLKMALELRKRRSDKLGIEISKLSLAQNDFDLDHTERALQEARLALFRLVMIGAARYRADAESLIGQLLIRQSKPKEALERLKDAAAQHRQAGASLQALYDEGHAVTACIELGRIEGIVVRSQALAERLTIAPYPELGETLDLHLYQAWKMLAESSSRRGGDYTVPIRRAFSELCRKTAMLEPERRNQFLQQVPANRQILRFAQEEGLADPAKLEELMKRKQSGLI